MPIEYITTRNMENKRKEPAGSIRILKLKEENEATVKYKCPECGREEQRREKWGEPFITGEGANKKINVVCSKCGHKMTMLKLSKQIKKEEKAAKKQVR